jgi:hypothetical protein
MHYGRRPPFDLCHKYILYLYLYLYFVFVFVFVFRGCDEELLPYPEDRNGRHWVRVELSTILIKYAFKIAIQFWARRDNSVVPLAYACSVGPYLPVVRLARVRNPCPVEECVQRFSCFIRLRPSRSGVEATTPDHRRGGLIGGKMLGTRGGAFCGEIARAGVDLARMRRGVWQLSQQARGARVAAPL